MKKLLLIGVMLVVGSVLFAQRPWKVGIAISQYEKAPNFKIYMSDGRTLELKKLRGKVVLLDFGGLRCAACIEGQKTFKEKLFDKYSPDELEVIPVIVDCKKWEDIAAFQKKYGFDFPFAWDKDNTTRGAYLPKGSGVPLWFVINRFGIITGVGRMDGFDAAVKGALEQKERLKVRKLIAPVSEITPEIDKKLVTLDGIWSDFVISKKETKMQEWLVILNKAKNERYKVELSVEEGTLKVLDVKLGEKLKPIPQRRVEPEEVIDYSKGIQFQELTLDQALAKAKQEGKKVFLDCYTSWCGPCKTMNKYVFPLEMVGNLFNSHFVSVKMDIEKGEGINIKEKFGAPSVPTYLFLNADGTLYHRMVGSRASEGEFMKEVEGMLGDRGKTLPYLDSIYRSGNMPRDMYNEYIRVLAMSGGRDRLKMLLNEFKLKIGPDEQLHPDNWTVVQHASYGSEEFKSVVKHQAEWRKSVGDEKVDFFFFYNYNDQLSSFYIGNNHPSMVKTIEPKYVKVMEDLKSAPDFKDKKFLLEIGEWIGVGVQGSSQEISAAIRKIVEEGDNRKWEALIYFAPLVGSHDDFRYLIANKQKIMGSLNSVLLTPFLQDRFDRMKRRLESKE